jgi:hypothetical protein
LFAAFLDTCALVPMYLNDALLRLAEADTYRPLWSPDVLGELRNTLVVKLGVPVQAADRRIRQMRRYFPDAEVTGYESLVAAMTTDPKDRHVAAAFRGHASVIVTANLADFPDAALAPCDVTAIHPDEFLLNQLDLCPQVVLACLHQQAADYCQPSLAPDDLLDYLGRAGANGFGTEVRRLLGR